MSQFCTTHRESDYLDYLLMPVTFLSIEVVQSLAQILLLGNIS